MSGHGHSEGRPDTSQVRALSQGRPEGSFSHCPLKQQPQGFDTVISSRNINEKSIIYKTRRRAAEEAAARRLSLGDQAEQAGRQR